MHSFKSKIYKIGVNPYVIPPNIVLKEIFNQVKRDKGPIPVRGKLNNQDYIQTIVKYAGKWRLYLNNQMRKAAKADVGDWVEVDVEFDQVERTISMHPKLQLALNENIAAKSKYENLSPSRQKEIVKYIGFLKSEESVDRNVRRCILFLLGKERFVGRDKP